MKIIKKNKYNLVIILGLLASTFTFPHLTIANVQQNRKNKKTALIEQLEWVSSHEPENICHGYFVEPVLDPSGQPILPPKDSPTQISANTGSLSQKEPSVLSGDIVVLQPGRRLEADKAVIYPAKSGKYKAIALSGNVRAYEPGQLFIAKNAYFNLLEKSNEMHDVKYRFVLASPEQVNAHLVPLNSHQDKITGTVAWGEAKEVQQPKPKHSVLSNVTYTTCAPDTAQWKLITSKLKLNKETENGTAKNVRLDVAGFPVFYWPYLSFPLTNARKSGFLFPIIGSTNVSGFIFGLPYYWNIAPNYDDTITPTYYGKRGVLFTNHFRYLTEKSYGELLTSLIPNDQEFKQFQKDAATNPSYQNQPGFNDLLNASDNRYSVIWRNDTSFNPNWSSYIDYARVSDDYYLQDFGSVPEEISTNQLLQKADVQYVDEHWTFTALVQGYQTLHPVNRQVLGNAYSELPQLSLDGNFPDAWKGFGFTWKSQGTYFTRENEPNTAPSINGGRFEIRPGINHPFNWIWGFFDPQLQFDVTSYSLQNQIPPASNRITRALPIFDIDTGLFFDRNVNVHNQSYEQTLEPELYYLYIPYRNQNDIPNFDTGYIPFTYSQLFANNRFSGLDRIGDANQLSYSLTTRFINNQTGEQKFRFSIGEIYYFEEPRVQLVQNPTEDSNDFLVGLGTPPVNERVSPIATLATYNITRDWSLNGGYAWDPTVRKSITGSFYLSYTPAYNHIIDFGYSFIRNGDIVNTQELGSSENNLNQLSVDGAWPITARWSAIGIFNYNISQTHIQSYLGGLEYNSCCFRIRFVGGRTFSNVDEQGKFQMQNAFYLQLQLKGLGNIGTNSISSILTSNINGYVDPFQTNSLGNLEL